MIKTTKIKEERNLEKVEIKNELINDLAQLSTQEFDNLCDYFEQVKLYFYQAQVLLTRYLENDAMFFVEKEKIIQSLELGIKQLQLLFKVENMRNQRSKNNYFDLRSEKMIVEKNKLIQSISKNKLYIINMYIDHLTMYYEYILVYIESKEPKDSYCFNNLLDLLKELNEKIDSILMIEDTHKSLFNIVELKIIIDAFKQVDVSDKQINRALEYIADNNSCFKQ